MMWRANGSTSTTQRFKLRNETFRRNSSIPAIAILAHGIGNDERSHKPAEGSQKPEARSQKPGEGSQKWEQAFPFWLLASGFWLPSAGFRLLSRSGAKPVTGQRQSEG